MMMITWQRFRAAAQVVKLTNVSQKHKRRKTANCQFNTSDFVQFK